MTTNGRSGPWTEEVVKWMTAVIAWPFQIVGVLMPDTSLFSGWHLAEHKRFGGARISAGQSKACLKNPLKLKEGAYWEKDHISSM